MADNFVDYTKLNSYNYRLEIDIIDNGKLIEVPDFYITDLIVQNEFKTNFFPILKVGFLFPLDVYYNIQQKRNTVKFKIRLLRYILNDENPDDQDTEMNNNIIFDGLFQPITLSIDMPNNLDLAKTDLSGDSDVTISLEQATSDRDLRKAMELYFFKLDHVNCNKEIVNFIAEDTEIKNAIAYVFKKVGIDSVIMNRPDNIEVFKQIVVPPLNFKNAIEFMANTYGIFNDGFRQFLDFNNYYLLNNNLKQIPVSSTEYQNVYINIMKLSRGSLIKFGSYIDTQNKCYVINTANNISITSQGMISKEVAGNVIKIYERSELENAMEYDEKSKKFTFRKGYKQIDVNKDGYESTDKVVFAYNDSENESIINDYKNTSEYNNVEFTLTLHEIDISILTMNKRYVFRFEDIDYANIYNGTYMLDRLIYGFERSEDSISCLCAFKKIT